MAAHESLSSDQFEHLGDRGVRIGERTFPSIDNSEYKNSGRIWMRTSMVPMENGALSNVEHNQTEQGERFNINAPRHQLGVGGNPNLGHLFDTHPRGRELKTPEEVHSVLDEMSHQHLSQESVQTNRNWMNAVRQTKDDEDHG